MAKRFYFLRKKGYDTYDHHEKWNEYNAVIIVETSEKKAREKANLMSNVNYSPKHSINFLDKNEIVCNVLDIKNYKIGDVVMIDYGDDG